MSIRIMRDATSVYSAVVKGTINATEQFLSSGAFVDSPAAGTYRYTVEFTRADPIYLATAAKRFLSLLEARR